MSISTRPTRGETRSPAFSLASAQRALDRAAAIAQDGLAVGDEHHFDRQIQQRAQRLAERVVAEARLEVPKPARRAHPQAAGLIAEEAVSRNEGTRAGEPDHRLSR